MADTETLLTLSVLLLLIGVLIWLWKIIQREKDPIYRYGFFELDHPNYGNCPCGSPDCPANNRQLERGEGYLFVDEVMVEFRKSARSLDQLRLKRENVVNIIRESGAPARDYRAVLDRLTTPALFCRQGGVTQGLELEASAADAQRWWQHHRVPLRATPMIPLEERIVHQATPNEPLPQAILTILSQK